jgi:eukaryotic-like serine/threonine-protein kinase
MPYVGQRFGRYRIEEEIGAGGMGVVYRAYDEKLERDLALKVLTPGALNDEAARKRFRNEARVLSRLNHPAIQTIHDFDTFDGHDYLVSELVPRVSLDTRLQSGAHPNGWPLQFQGRRGSIHHEPEPDDSRFRSR